MPKHELGLFVYRANVFWGEFMKQKMIFDWYESECTARSAVDLLCDGSTHFKLSHIDDDAHLHLMCSCRGQCRPENRIVSVTDMIEQATQTGKELVIDAAFKAFRGRVYGTRFGSDVISKDQWTMHVCCGGSVDPRHLTVSQALQGNRSVFTVSVKFCDNTCKRRRIKLPESLCREAREQVEHHRHKRRYLDW